MADTFAYAAQAGCDGVEIAPFTLASSVNDISAAERRRIRDTAARAGVEVVGLHWLLVKAEGLHLTSPDAAPRDWLAEQAVRPVAMEAPGVHGLCADEGLEMAGLEVLVVNGKHVKNLPGRKTGRKDCPWSATLHAHGRLRSGFGPPERLRRRRDYLRLRADPVTRAAGHGGNTCQRPSNAGTSNGAASSVRWRG